VLQSRIASEYRALIPTSSDMRLVPALRGRSIVLAIGAALMLGCGRSEQAAVVPAGKTVPPPVMSSPPKPPPQFFRDHYGRLEDCVHDWGYAQKCIPVPPGSPAQQAGAGFFGPTYARDYREETQVQLRKEALDGGYAQSVPGEASDKSVSKSEVKP
jgi:hypothetical protein